ncbi:MAG: transglutaminase domain-containing protein, partial [Desulfobacteraceae bacterium]
FASATVLLLRSAGLPARYAVGYLVKEYSPLEKRYVVRARHAHAWTLVWYDHAWHEFDTTPPTWVQSEEKSASLLQPLFDFFAWGVFKFTSGWQHDRDRISKYFWWLLIPLLIWSALKFKLISRAKSWVKQQPRTNARLIAPGSDSEFYLIEKMLTDRGLPRLPAETLSAWLKRIAEANLDDLFDFKKLETALNLHYRYRFDPIGITPAERLDLKNKIDSWLKSERMREKIIAPRYRAAKDK